MARHFLPVARLGLAYKPVYFAGAAGSILATGIEGGPLLLRILNC